jgi:hypothetical protein
VLLFCGNYDEILRIGVGLGAGLWASSPPGRSGSSLEAASGTDLSSAPVQHQLLQGQRGVSLNTSADWGNLVFRLLRFDAGLRRRYFQNLTGGTCLRGHLLKGFVPGYGCDLCADSSPAFSCSDCAFFICKACLVKSRVSSPSSSSCGGSDSGLGS